ncbi:hypothetical protein [Vibrio sonorensis]|uniref:hypothetical protein n=1 Tax=Vibrio sonorensis TaxID=1004316 RepID=UPI0008DAD9EF|nr:hypothetical protein [Vibrio sonorensis]
MNRTLCTLSILNNKVHFILGRYLNGRLYIKESFEVRDEVSDSGVVASRSDKIKSLLSDQSSKGVAVYVDEAVPKFSENYDHSPLIFSENSVINDALRSYFDLESSQSIVWGEGARVINATSIAQSTIDDKGKASFSINAPELSASVCAMLLMCYHATNCDLTDISYLKKLRVLREQSRSQSATFRSRRRRKW